MIICVNKKDLGLCLMLGPHLLMLVYLESECVTLMKISIHIETISTERIIGSHDANLFEGKIKETLDKRGLYGKV